MKKSIAITLSVAFVLGLGSLSALIASLLMEFYITSAISALVYVSTVITSALALYANIKKAPESEPLLQPYAIIVTSYLDEFYGKHFRKHVLYNQGEFLEFELEPEEHFEGNFKSSQEADFYMSNSRSQDLSLYLDHIIEPLYEMREKEYASL